MIKNSSTMLV